MVKELSQRGGSFLFVMAEFRPEDKYVKMSFYLCLAKNLTAATGNQNE